MVESKSPSNPDVVGAGGTWALLLSSSLTVMGGAVVAPALPRIHQAFAGDWQSLLLTKLVLTLPALAIAVAAPGGGRILARFGKRRVLLAGLL
ncbi:MAG: MFS transporter, partial [Planctomycetota bacterium]